MKWYIPAKTFLIGEYVAITGGPAIVLTTPTYFTLAMVKPIGLHGIHIDSPAAKWWRQQPPIDIGLNWHDPYNNIGGMGASSAQFVGVYHAYTEFTQQAYTHQQMLHAYINVAYDGVGLAPSGYDLLAQAYNLTQTKTEITNKYIYINQHTQQLCEVPWNFADIRFITLHTGKKLATHQHLKTLNNIHNLSTLTEITNMAKTAFDTTNSLHLIQAINAYYQQLQQQNLVAEHTAQYIQQLKLKCNPLAIKGCGAMGADVILLIVATEEYDNTMKKLEL